MICPFYGTPGNFILKNNICALLPVHKWGHLISIAIHHPGALCINFMNSFSPHKRLDQFNMLIQDPDLHILKRSAGITKYATISLTFLKMTDEMLFRTNPCSQFYPQSESLQSY